MQGKIALEEHFAIPDTLMDSAGFVPDSYWPELKDRLLDIQDKRLAQMDRHGVEMMILSLNAPAVQAIPDVARANEIAIRANDFLAEQVAKRPSRFQAFAPLPEDCAIYEGHPWLMGPTWAFGQETAVHALRLMGSGLFDAHPNLKIILGHMGEGLPYSMWRVDHRNGWVKAPPKHKAKKKICDYFNANFFLTTSGNFRTQTLIDSILEIGADRILFSVDWPFETVDHAFDWFNSASIAENDRHKIGRRNAIDLFKLDLGETAVAGHSIHHAAE